MRALLLLALLLAGCAEAPGACGLRKVAELKVTLRGTVPLMIAEANGQLATMILDTGAQGTLLTQAAAARMGLHVDPRQAVTMSGVGGSSRNYPAIATRFGIGGIALPDQRVMMLPFALPRVADAEVDGLLGADVLGRFEVDLDLPHRRAGLYAGTPCGGEALPMPDAVPLDSVERERNWLVAGVRLDGAPMRALLDTGAARSLVTLPAAARLGLGPEAFRADPRLQLHGAGPQTAEARLHRFGELVIGAERWRGPVLEVSAPPQPESDVPLLAATAPLDMIIGEEFFSTHRLWLAYPRGKVFVQRPAGGAVALAR